MLAARIVAAVIALGACLALAQAPLRSFEIQIAERRVSPAQRVLRGYDIETRVAPGKPGVTAFAARHHHRALLHVEIHPR